jgi:uncharacterized protein
VQFLITGYDGTDADAPGRRQAARLAHLEGVKKLREAGRFIEGGAILDDAGQMIGSALIIDFESEAEMRSWLNSDPYVSGNVWQKIEVKPFRCAPK